MKYLIKNIITMLVVISLYLVTSGILNHYSIKYSKEAQKYEKLYNNKVSAYSSKKSDLSYYKSGLYIKKVVNDRYGFIDPNDNPSLISYSKVVTDDKDVSFTVIMDLFTTSLSADELKTIYSYWSHNEQQKIYFLINSIYFNSCVMDDTAILNPS